jgi:hypothetical protein
MLGAVAGVPDPRLINVKLSFDFAWKAPTREILSAVASASAPCRTVLARDWASVITPAATNIATNSPTVAAASGTLISRRECRLRNTWAPISPARPTITAKANHQPALPALE